MFIFDRQKDTRYYNLFCTISVNKNTDLDSEYIVNCKNQLTTLYKNCIVTPIPIGRTLAGKIAVFEVPEENKLFIANNMTTHYIDKSKTNDIVFCKIKQDDRSSIVYDCLKINEIDIIGSENNSALKSLIERIEKFLDAKLFMTIIYGRLRYIFLLTYSIYLTS
jgi:hypothetical protein